jgi:hypothetical protein
MPAKAPRAEAFLKGGETINTTTMFPSQDTVQPNVNTKLTETITKGMQAPEEPQGDTIGDRDMIVEAVPRPRTRKRDAWVRYKPRSEASAKTARNSRERPKRQTDISKTNGS